MVDAVFVIILLSLASALIVQADFDTENESGRTADTCDLIFESKMSQKEFGYGPDDRVMAISDLAAASISMDDGKISEYLRKILDAVYPWENGYSLTMEYGNDALQLNEYGQNYSEKAVRTYPVEFGGELRVTLAVYR